MHKLAPLIVVLAGCSCSPSTEAVGDAPEPGVSWGVGPHNKTMTPSEKILMWVRTHPGACSDACCEVLTGTCPDADLCARADYEPDDVITCAGHALTCADARAAGRGDAVGLAECWRDCEGLRN